MMKKVNTTTNYGFYSKVLNKPFDTLEELIAAEEAVLKAKEEQAAEKAARKAEANKVEDAFKARNAARRKHNEEFLAAKKAYNTALVEAKKAFDDAVAKSTAAIDKAEAAYSAALTEFTSKHPEGYHLTLKDGDNVTVLSSQGTIDSAAKVHAEYNDLLDFIFGRYIKK